MNSLNKIILLLLIILICASSVDAAGNLRKLKGLSDDMALKDKALDQETDNYNRAKDFISSDEVSVGISKEKIIELCGDPVARVDNDTRWVYKPSTATFFKGEKICRTILTP